MFKIETVLWIQLIHASTWYVWSFWKKLYNLKVNEYSKANPSYCMHVWVHSMQNMRTYKDKTNHCIES